MKLASPAYEYESGTWEPMEAAAQVAPPGGWVNPVIASLVAALKAGSFQ